MTEAEKTALVTDLGVVQLMLTKRRDELRRKENPDDKGTLTLVNQLVTQVLTVADYVRATAAGRAKAAR